MLVRFLPKLKTTHARKTIRTFLAQPLAQILVGSPDLSLALADSLLFQNPYTVGFLAFEEKDLPQAHKYRIIQQFEASFLAGLSGDQYCNCWIEHHARKCLHLCFFIPNVELRTQKRLNPYYDRADRPLCENFQRAINLTYGLTAPDDPQKRQTVKISNNLPETIKHAVRALNGVIETRFKNGLFQNRADLLLFLEKMGFEIARITPKAISIKNEGGMNIRLRGAFYEQDFGISEKSGTDRKTTRTSPRNRDSSESRTAWERLNQAIGRKIQENRKRFG